MKNQPWYVYALLVIILGGLAYFAYFKRGQTELKSLRDERLKTENEVTTLLAKKKQLDKIEEELVSLNRALAEIEVIIPRKKEIGEILRNVQQMAFDSRLEIIHIAQAKENNKDIYSEQPIPIEVVGNYHNLGLFFDRVLHLPRLFNIDDFSIRALPGQSPAASISAAFTAKTYFFLEPSQIPKPEINRPKKPLKEDDEIK